MQQSNSTEGNRDLVLAPGSYAYVQAENNGSIRTHVGPTVVTLSGQERPIRYDAESKVFHRCKQEQAVCNVVYADEGDYIVLSNPAPENKHPATGESNDNPKQLEMGSRIVIPGPATFALWPQQEADVIAGHELASNQYLLARVYNENQARKHWGKQITSVKDSEEESTPQKGDNTVAGVSIDDLKLGKIIVIKGTDLSFYIPPTGIEVIEDESENYVRDAVTLEQLEYCILVDEDGNKRYERGPSVVFPKPTERFIFDKKSNSRKFKAIELTKMSGIHIKVVAEYKEGDEGEKGQKIHKPGDELFITGEDQPIYFPRIEHSIIRYRDQERHFAVAIPAGEGRYVLNRDNGEIDMVRGPKMLLVDPRTKVIVRRILSTTEVCLWYPGNKEAASYNKQLAEASGSTQFIEEDVYSKSVEPTRRRRGLQPVAASFMPDDDYAAEVASSELVAEEFHRRTSFTPPRTITLDTKFDGVPAIGVWTGYAVMVVNKRGERKVYRGPTNILLQYDESLEQMALSTGKPKNTDNKRKTAYLRITNNKVSDIVSVETKDHVEVNIKISMMVNFEGKQPELWFASDNYVKLLCDHVRSVLKGTAQKIDIETLYQQSVPIVRDAVLGKSSDGKPRPGMVFPENGMRVKDVEVLGFDIGEERIANLLQNAQFSAVESNINLQDQRKQMEVAKQREEMKRNVMDAETTTKLHGLDLNARHHNKMLTVNIQKIESEQQQAAKQKEANSAHEKAVNIEHEWKLKRSKEQAVQDQEIATQKQELMVKMLHAEMEAAIKRFEAGKGGMVEALLALNRDEVMTKIAEATSIQTIIGGDSFVEVLQKIFKGSPISDHVASLADMIPKGIKGIDEMVVEIRDKSRQ